jgi:hypothetical protein
VQVVSTVELVPVSHIEIRVPPELRLDRVDPSPGWTATRDGQTVRYRGPAIANTCKYFSIGVTPLTAGTYSIPVVLRDAAGNIVANTTHAADTDPTVQLVYAGVKPPSPADPGPSGVTIAGAVLVGIGIALVATLAVRSWRARRADAREAEVQARVESFKEQARNRSRDSAPH